MRSLKIIFLIAIKYFQRNYKIIFIIIATLAALIFLTIKFKDKIFYPTISEGFIGTYQRHDLPEIVTRLLSKGLMEIDSKGRAVPALAESFSVDKEAKQFTFKLKKDLMWSDNTPLKASDLGFKIPEVEASFPDDQTIVFKLKDSYSPFPTLLAAPVFKKDTLVGTGPYQVLSIQKSQVFITKIVLRPLKLGELPKIIIRFYPNEKIAATAFSIGEVTSVFGINDLHKFTASKITKFATQELTTKIVAILYNTEDNLLSNRSFRQALSYSTPKIEENLSKTSIHPTSWAYFDEVNDYLDNPEGAKLALQRAKNSSSKDQKFELTLTVTPQLEFIGTKVVDAWKKLGVSAVLRVESGIPQNFQALLITLSIPEDPDQYSLWHSTQTKTNVTKYNKARVDKDLEDGRKLINEDDRKEKYHDFQRTLMEDSPATFLYFPKYHFAYLKKIEEDLVKVLPMQLPK